MNELGLSAEAKASLLNRLGAKVGATRPSGQAGAGPSEPDRPALGHADVIHVMEGGRIVQSGTWESLRADAGGRFEGLAQRFVLSGELA